MKFYKILAILLMFLNYLNATVYEDAEDGNTNGWSIYTKASSQAKISNVIDGTGRVIELTGRKLDDGFMLGDMEGRSGSWNNTTDKRISWRMKYNSIYYIYIRVVTSEGPMYMIYRPTDSSPGYVNRGSSGVFIYIGLGTATIDGSWQTISRDLEADIQAYRPPGVTLTSIHAFLIRGGGRIDDIMTGSPDEDGGSSSTPNQAPTANAGADQRVVAGTAVTLEGSGSRDSDGNIATYRWTEGAAALSTNASFSKNDFSVGTHTLTLTVTDDDGATDSDTVVITVTELPQADTTAPTITLNGTNPMSITQGETYTELGATANDNIDGSVTVTISGSVDTNTVGTYTITYRAIDSAGNSAEVTRTVTVVAGSAPIPNVNNGTVYEDAEDGNTNGWSIYTKASSQAKISNVIDSTGRVIELTGRKLDDGFMLGDMEGKSGSWNNTTDKTISWRMKYSSIYYIYIRVVTSEGPMYMIYRPTDSSPGYVDRGSSGLFIYIGLGTATIDGSWHTITRDLEADIQTYRPGVTLKSIHAFLIRGGGRLDDMMTGSPDEDGGSSTPNQAPTANAGADQTVVEGTTVTLDGSGSRDSDGNIATYRWTEGAAALSSNASFSKNDFSVGTHTLTLTVTDDDGATATDTVTITVAAAPVSNQAPTANAGTDQSVVEGTAVTLEGSGSRDSDGNIVSYRWREGAMELNTNASFSKNDFSVGTHTLTLTVTDNDGATDTDTVMITITAAPVANQAPTANAGADQTVVEGTSITLDGSGSRDSDGNIATYRWTEGAAELSTNASFSKNDFSVGTHTLTLTVTDNDGATATDTIVITVTSLATSSGRAFITIWKTDNPDSSDPVVNDPRAFPENNNRQIRINTVGQTGVYAFDYTIDWGDGTVDTHVGQGETDPNIQGNIVHTYATPGIYTIKITGTFPRIYLGHWDEKKLLSVEQWGDIEWATMKRAFRGCANMVINATDTPDLSQVTNMELMFSGCKALNQDIGDWDVSHITEMSAMFRDATAFNQDISRWDVSNVRGMSAMFINATAFNQDISRWNVSTVSTMSEMFNGSGFNQDIGDWDVSNVRSMSFMFANSRFNQNIGAWNVSRVTNMGGMFRKNTAFDQDISDWDVSNVKTMYQMFLNGGLSVANYSKLLRQWSRLDLYANVQFDAANSRYNASVANDRQAIINNFKWKIRDAGQAN